MAQHTMNHHERIWQESGHASLCLLGSYLQEQGFFHPLESGWHSHQKMLKYTPVQKLEMLFISILAGAKAVSHTNFTLRPDPALYRAFGLPGCAEQSVIADTLDAMTETDLRALREAVTVVFAQYSQARRHDFRQAVLILDVDLSPLPVSRHAEGSERAYMGHSRLKTGRKLVRVCAVQYQETVWEEVRPGHLVESLDVLQAVLEQAEQRLGLAGESADVQAKRARTEIRLDSAWGSDGVIRWLLARGYQVTGKFKSTLRVRKLVQGIQEWQETSSPGRVVASVPHPLAFERPLAQYAVRTPSAEKASGYYYAILFTSLIQRTMTEVVAEYDGRAGIEKRQPHYSHSTHSAVQPAWSDVLSILRVSQDQQSGPPPGTSGHAFRLQSSADVAAVTGRFQRHRPTRSSVWELAPRAGRAPSRDRPNCRG